MWYKSAKAALNEPIGLEYKLLRMCVVHLIKRKLLITKGICNTDNKKVNAWTNNILKKIKDKYRNFNFVRKHSDNGTLMPIVEPFVDEAVRNAR